MYGMYSERWGGMSVRALEHETAALPAKPCRANKNILVGVNSRQL